MSIAEHLLTLGESLSDILNDCNDALVEKGVSVAGNLRGVADLIRQIRIGSGGGSGGSGGGDYDYEYTFIGNDTNTLNFTGYLGSGAAIGDEWLMHIEAIGEPRYQVYDGYGHYVDGELYEGAFVEGDFVVKFQSIGGYVTGRFISYSNIKVVDEGDIVEGYSLSGVSGGVVPRNGKGDMIENYITLSDIIFPDGRWYKVQIQTEYTGDNGGEDVGGDTGGDNTGSGDNTGDNGDTPLTGYDYSGTVTVSNKTTLDLNISGLSDINVNGIYLELEGAGDDYVVTKIENGTVEYQYQDEITDGGNLSATLNRGMQGNEDLGITISANIEGSSEALIFDGTYTWGYTT